MSMARKTHFRDVRRVVWVGDWICGLIYGGGGRTC